MSSNLYALLFRMKNINRWSLMHCAESESLSRHSLETAMIAHALAVIENRRLGGNVNEERAALIAMFHDAPEILTGDLPTPVKHGSRGIEEAYVGIEREAKELLVGMAPDYMRETVSGILNETDEEILRLVKAADKISAYFKCLEELKMGNPEFSDAAESSLEAVRRLSCPAALIFLEEFTEGFSLTLDKLKGS